MSSEWGDLTKTDHKKPGDLTLQDLTLTDQIARVGNAGPDKNDEPNDTGGKCKTCMTMTGQNAEVLSVDKHENLLAKQPLIRASLI